MLHLHRDITINAKPDAVWAVLSRYMHIDEFAPFIDKVDALTDGENGVGSKRRNHFSNGDSMVAILNEIGITDLINVDWRYAHHITDGRSDPSPALLIRIPPR